MSIGIHIFRKDLRIVDNLALNELSKQVDTIIPIFILDPTQIIKSKQNENYFSPRAARFLLDCLIDLNTYCKKLYIFKGDPQSVLKKLIKEIQPSHISFNADYTKYSLERDKSIIALCKANQIVPVVGYDDQTLHNMDNLIKVSGEPYMVFGPFYKHAATKVSNPTTNKIKFSNINIQSISISDPFIQSKYKDKTNIFAGGRFNALKQLRKKASIVGFKHRDILANHSFEISAYINFGCISVREVHHYFKINKIEATRELYWRDFFLCILRFKPGANSYTQPMSEKFKQIKWRKVSSKQALSEWYSFLNSSTGFVLIDAIMKQLINTGYIGNRSRLLLATFWTKYLMINPFDPIYGAQTGFSRMLVDCNTSQNKLNIQWVLSELDLSGRRFAKKETPTISGRMIRIDNKMISKYDPDLIYIKQWLPEYTDKTKKELVSTPTLFEWETRYSEYCKRLE